MQSAVRDSRSETQVMLDSILTDKYGDVLPRVLTAQNDHRAWKVLAGQDFQIELPLRHSTAACTSEGCRP